ncbi:hypothetical protein MRQ36_01945 [Micromonospora sp. R77]|uniref:hypothetical protein n=1 Tax=Micromonospora sp. R77 TaxID=2925836 RepID=UPI001F60AC48|nr:hypothetical protein [Micromonospora sp. R77]MCI4061403.1 hypothetical protein [Micromonospora sp. R77]
MAEANYNLASTEIDVSPSEMQSAAETIKGIITSIAEHWETIGKTWTDLKLGWIGDSADAATQFNTRLTDIQERLFGVPSADGETVETPGLLDQLRGGVLVAAANYDSVELSVKDMWKAFSEQMAQEPEDSGDGAPPPSKDTTLDPIKADYVDNPYPWHKPEES